MTAGFERGFKAKAERIALEVRERLGLSAYDRLDPHALAGRLGITVIPLPELVRFGADESSIRHFLDVAPGELSALTITHGDLRLIVENPRHSTGRRSSSLTHELSHILLSHAPGPVFGTGGCRRWNQKEEDEAEWLAAVLLVPRLAALRFARLGTPVAVAAFNMGVSAQLLRWRMNHTGAVAQVERERSARAGRGRRS